MVDIDQGGSFGKRGRSEKFKTKFGSGVQAERTTTSWTDKKRQKWDKQMGLRAFGGLDTEKKDRFCELCGEKIEEYSCSRYINGNVRTFDSADHLKEYVLKLKDNIVCEWCGKPIFGKRHIFKKAPKRLFCSHDCAFNWEGFVE